MPVLLRRVRDHLREAMTRRPAVARGGRDGALEKAGTDAYETANYRRCGA
jgi:hypothetical protein